MPAVSAEEVSLVLKKEHEALRRHRLNEPYCFPRLQELLDRLGYPQDASIGFILKPLSQASKRELPRVLEDIVTTILERARR